MKAYMGYSQSAGPAEGALLVFANSARTARKLAFRAGWVESWIDQAVKLIKDPLIFKLADQDKLNAGLAHVVNNPAHCVACGLWGGGVTVDGKCGNCNEYPGDELAGLFGGTFADLPIGTRFYFADDSFKKTYTKTSAFWASLGDIGVKVRPGAAVRIEVEE